MAPIWAIASTTVRGALRSRVIHILLLVLAVVSIFPMLLSGDGTVHGQLQLTLTYSLGMVGAVLSLVTVWLGCTQLSLDIESHRIHLLVTKPVSMLSLWLGKLLGIVFIQAVLLALSATLILILTQLRLHNSNFDEQELAQVKRSVMTGRKVYHPNRPSPEELVETEFQRRRREGLLDPKLPESIQRSTILREIRKSLDEIPYQQTRPWVIRGLPVLQEGEVIHLRYRIYLSKVKDRVRSETSGIWHLFDPETGKAMTAPQRVTTGQYHEIPIPAHVIKDGELRVAYTNLTPKQEVAIIQHIDGPHALMPVASFVNNYSRAVLLVFLQVVAIAAFSCAAGGAFSTSTAAFLICAYLMLGGMVDFMTPARPEHEVIPTTGLARLQYKIRLGAQFITVGVNEYSDIASLAHGHLIELGNVAIVAVKLLIFRALPISLLGVFLLRRRELGAVLRP